MSAAFSLEGAVPYIFPVRRTFQDDTCNMLRITLPAGTRALLLAGVNEWNGQGENEVLLDGGLVFDVKKRAHKRYVLWEGWDVMTGTQCRVTDLVLRRGQR